MDDQQLTTKEISARLATLSSPFANSAGPLAIILAAGHGKRIKSATSKMLHEIWGEPTVLRVAHAAHVGLQAQNQIIVVGIKALEVAAAIGKRAGLQFVYQSEQNGTGHAVRVALEQLPRESHIGDVFIFPGDMGLIDSETTHMFKQAFAGSGCDMMVLTGVYDGDPGGNSYGRILRVPRFDIEHRSSGKDHNKVIEIKEHKDILALAEDETYQVEYKNRDYVFTRQELLENAEFNTGVFGFKAKSLIERIKNLDTDNAQGELYLTDLISIFNSDGLTVGAISAADNRTVVGFNTKSVLREMNDIARDNVYNRLKDLVAFEDKFDFFLADDVIEQIIKIDREQGPLDLGIGKGAHVGKGVVLNRGVQIGRAVHLEGVVELGTACRIGDGVRVMGSPERPTRLGNNVTVKGNSIIIGCVVQDDVLIEHSILESKRIKRIQGSNGLVQAVRFVRPQSEGLSAVDSL